jgi:hypothetical protein
MSNRRKSNPYVQTNEPRELSAKFVEAFGRLDGLDQDIVRLSPPEGMSFLKVLVRNETGDPPANSDADIVFNTVDHTAKFKAAGAWHTFTITW